MMLQKNFREARRNKIPKNMSLNVKLYHLKIQFQGENDED